MKKFLLVTLGISVLLATAIATASLVRESVTKKRSPIAFGTKQAGLQIGVKAIEPTISFVEGGGYGEFVTLFVAVETTDSDWERLSEIEGHSFDPRADLFLVKVTSDDPVAKLGPLTISPTDLQFGSSNCDGSGSKWTYSLQVPLGSIESNWAQLPRNVGFEVVIGEDAVKRITRRNSAKSLASGKVAVCLEPIRIDHASFTARLHSLSAGATANDVQRVLGKPLAKSPIEEAVKQDWPEITSKWEYRNPNLKGRVAPEKEGVTLFFDANDGLLGFREAVYGC